MNALLICCSSTLEHKTDTPCLISRRKSLDLPSVAIHRETFETKSGMERGQEGMGTERAGRTRRGDGVNGSVST